MLAGIIEVRAVCAAHSKAPVPVGPAPERAIAVLTPVPVPADFDPSTSLVAGVGGLRLSYYDGRRSFMVKPELYFIIARTLTVAACDPRSDCWPI